MRLFIGLSKDPLFLGIQLILTVFQFLLELSSFAAVAFQFLFFLLHGNSFCFQFGYNVLEGFCLRADLFFCLVNDIVRKPKLGRNGKGITLAGNTDQQTIGGLQCFHAEFTAGVFHTRCRQGIDFEFAVVCSCHGADALLMQMRQDSDSQCRTLGRIRTGPQLIKQHQRVTIRLLQEGDDIGHMRGEGT